VERCTFRYFASSIPCEKLKIENICVYCGSSSGKNPAFARAATALAKEMCKRDIGLVYGGAAVGIMGAVADAVLEAGGRAIGVIPKSLAIKEVAHETLTELHVVGSWRMVLLHCREVGARWKRFLRY